MASVAADRFKYGVMHVIRNSFLSPNYHYSYYWEVDELETVRNLDLETQYQEKIQDFLHKGRSKEERIERLLMGCYTNEKDVRLISLNGLQCGKHGTTSYLGNGTKGVTLGRHADILLKCFYNDGHEQCWLVIYKVALGRQKEVLPIQTPPFREPMQDADCHVSLLAPVSSEDCLRVQEIKAQVYIYDRDESGEFLLRPRQCVPIAYVKFKRALSITGLSVPLTRETEVDIPKTLSTKEIITFPKDSLTKMKENFSKLNELFESNKGISINAKSNSNSQSESKISLAISSPKNYSKASNQQKLTKLCSEVAPQSITDTLEFVLCGKNSLSGLRKKNGLRNREPSVSEKVTDKFVTEIDVDCDASRNMLDLSDNSTNLSTYGIKRNNGNIPTQFEKNCERDLLQTISTEEIKNHRPQMHTSSEAAFSACGLLSESEKCVPMKSEKRERFPQQCLTKAKQQVRLNAPMAAAVASLCTQKRQLENSQSLSRIVVPIRSSAIAPKAKEVVSWTHKRQPVPALGIRASKRNSASHHCSLATRSGTSFSRKGSLKPISSSSIASPVLSTPSLLASTTLQMSSKALCSRNCSKPSYSLLQNTSRPRKQIGAASLTAPEKRGICSASKAKQHKTLRHEAPESTNKSTVVYEKSNCMSKISNSLFCLKKTLSIANTQANTQVPATLSEQSIQSQTDSVISISHAQDTSVTQISSPEMAHTIETGAMNVVASNNTSAKRIIREACVAFALETGNKDLPLPVSTSHEIPKNSTILVPANPVHDVATKFHHHTNSSPSLSEISSRYEVAVHESFSPALTEASSTTTNLNPEHGKTIHSKTVKFTSIHVAPQTQTTDVVNINPTSAPSTSKASLEICRELPATTSLISKQSTSDELLDGMRHSGPLCKQSRLFEVSGAGKCGAVLDGASVNHPQKLLMLQHGFISSIIIQLASDLNDVANLLRSSKSDQMNQKERTGLLSLREINNKFTALTPICLQYKQLFRAFKEGHSMSLPTSCQLYKQEHMLNDCCGILGEVFSDLKTSQMNCDVVQKRSMTVDWLVNKKDTLITCLEAIRTVLECVVSECQVQKEVTHDATPETNCTRESVPQQLRNEVQQDPELNSQGSNTQAFIYGELCQSGAFQEASRNLEAAATTQLLANEHTEIYNHSPTSFTGATHSELLGMDASEVTTSFNNNRKIPYQYYLHNDSVSESVAHCHNRGAKSKNETIHHLVVNEKMKIGCEEQQETKTTETGRNSGPISDTERADVKPAIDPLESYEIEEQNSKGTLSDVKKERPTALRTQIYSNPKPFANDSSASNASCAATIEGNVIILQADDAVIQNGSRAKSVGTNVVPITNADDVSNLHSRFALIPGRNGNPSASSYQISIPDGRQDFPALDYINVPAKDSLSIKTEQNEFKNPSDQPLHTIIFDADDFIPPSNITMEDSDDADAALLSRICIDGIGSSKNTPYSNVKCKTENHDSNCQINGSNCDTGNHWSFVSSEFKGSSFDSNEVEDIPPLLTPDFAFGVSSIVYNVKSDEPPILEVSIDCRSTNADSFPDIQTVKDFLAPATSNAVTNNIFTTTPVSRVASCRFAPVLETRADVQSATPKYILPTDLYRKQMSFGLRQETNQCLNTSDNVFVGRVVGELLTVEDVATNNAITENNNLGNCLCIEHESVATSVFQNFGVKNSCITDVPHSFDLQSNTPGSNLKTNTIEESHSPGGLDSVENNEVLFDNNLITHQNALLSAPSYAEYVVKIEPEEDFYSSSICSFYSSDQSNVVFPIPGISQDDFRIDSSELVGKESRFKECRKSNIVQSSDKKQDYICQTEVNSVPNDNAQLSPLTCQRPENAVSNLEPCEKDIPFLVRNKPATLNLPNDLNDNHGQTEFPSAVKKDFKLQADQVIEPQTGFNTSEMSTSKATSFCSDLFSQSQEWSSSSEIHLLFPNSSVQEKSVAAIENEFSSSKISLEDYCVSPPAVYTEPPQSPTHEIVESHFILQGNTADKNFLNQKACRRHKKVTNEEPVVVTSEDDDPVSSEPQSKKPFPDWSFKMYNRFAEEELRNSMAGLTKFLPSEILQRKHLCGAAFEAFSEDRKDRCSVITGDGNNSIDTYKLRRDSYTDEKCEKNPIKSVKRTPSPTIFAEGNDVKNIEIDDARQPSSRRRCERFQFTHKKVYLGNIKGEKKNTYSKNSSNDQRKSCERNRFSRSPENDTLKIRLGRANSHELELKRRHWQFPCWDNCKEQRFFRSQSRCKSNSLTRYDCRYGQNNERPISRRVIDEHSKSRSRLLPNSGTSKERHRKTEIISHSRRHSWRNHFDFDIRLLRSQSSRSTGRCRPSERISYETRKDLVSNSIHNWQRGVDSSKIKRQFWSKGHPRFRCHEGCEHTCLDALTPPACQTDTNMNECSRDSYIRKAPILHSRYENDILEETLAVNLNNLEAEQHKEKKGESPLAEVKGEKIRVKRDVKRSFNVTDNFEDEYETRSKRSRECKNRGLGTKEEKFEEDNEINKSSATSKHSKSPAVHERDLDYDERMNVSGEKSDIVSSSLARTSITYVAEVLHTSNFSTQVYIEKYPQ